MDHSDSVMIVITTIFSTGIFSFGASVKVQTGTHLLTSYEADGSHRFEDSSLFDQSTESAKR